MYKKRRNNKYKYIIVATIVILLLLLINLVFKNGHKTSFVEDFFKDTTSIIYKVITSPINYASDLMGNSKDKKNVYKKYEEMKKKYEQIELYETKINELEEEIKRLKELTNIDKTLSEYSYLNANVINRNVGYWYDTITINKGSSSGITNDLAVITSKGLVGKIINTSKFTSTVKLITSDELNMKISVKIKVDDDYVYGLLTSYQKGYFIIEGISKISEIKEGAEVTTTGMSDIFPSGILIGKVSKVTEDNFELAKIVKVKSTVDFDAISYVTILKRELND